MNSRIKTERYYDSDEIAVTAIYSENEEQHGEIVELDTEHSKAPPLVIDDTEVDFANLESHDDDEPAASELSRRPMHQKGPIEIKLQEKKKLRLRTFYRRKATLMNAAKVLAIITNSKVRVWIESERGKIFSFNSHPIKKRDVSLQVESKMRDVCLQVGRSQPQLSTPPPVQRQKPPVTKNLTPAPSISTGASPHVVKAMPVRSKCDSTSIKPSKPNKQSTRYASRPAVNKRKGSGTERKLLEPEIEPTTNRNNGISPSRHIRQRTMWVRCEEDGCNVFSEANITKIGAFRCSTHKKKPD